MRLAKQDIDYNEIFFRIFSIVSALLYYLTLKKIA